MTAIEPGEFSQNIQLGIEVVATLAFALSGILEGARKRLDAVGVCVVAFLAAFGGGTLRDLLLDVRPFFWVSYIELLWAVFGLCIVAMLCAFFGGWAYIGLRELGNPAYINMLGCVVLTVSLRAFAVWKNVRLPEWRN